MFHLLFYRSPILGLLLRHSGVKVPFGRTSSPLQRLRERGRRNQGRSIPSGYRPCILGKSGEQRPDDSPRISTNSVWIIQSAPA